MKQLILFASMMLTLTTLAQWETEYYVDDFGEPTGETFEYFDELGVFSNSATTNSECAYFVKHDKNSESFSISIYPYNNNSKESWISSTFQEVKIKNPSGEVVIIKAFCYKKGQIVFSDEEYPIFRDAVSDVGDYTFLMKYEGKYSASTYKFKFTIK